MLLISSCSIPKPYRTSPPSAPPQHAHFVEEQEPPPNTMRFVVCSGCRGLCFHHCPRVRHSSSRHFAIRDCHGSDRRHVAPAMANLEPKLALEWPRICCLYDVSRRGDIAICHRVGRDWSKHPSLRRRLMHAARVGVAKHLHMTRVATGSTNPHCILLYEKWAWEFVAVAY